MSTGWKPGYTWVLFFSLVSFALGHAPALASGQVVIGSNRRIETVLVWLLYSRAR